MVPVDYDDLVSFCQLQLLQNILSNKYIYKYKLNAIYWKAFQQRTAGPIWLKLCILTEDQAAAMLSSKQAEYRVVPHRVLTPGYQQVYNSNVLKMTNTLRGETARRVWMI